MPWLFLYIIYLCCNSCTYLVVIWEGGLDLWKQFDFYGFYPTNLQHIKVLIEWDIQIPLLIFKFRIFNGCRAIVVYYTVVGFSRLDMKRCSGRQTPAYKWPNRLFWESMSSDNDSRKNKCMYSSRGVTSWDTVHTHPSCRFGWQILHHIAFGMPER
jgi:hypothetical protein